VNIAIAVDPIPAGLGQRLVGFACHSSSPTLPSKKARSKDAPAVFFWGISQKQASGESANARGRKQARASCPRLNFGASPLP